MKVLETQRLVLRRLTAEDGEFILELLNDPAWLRYIGDKGVQTLDDASDYILNGPVAMYEQFGFGLYLVERKDESVPIGICGLVKRDSLEDADVGFAFLPQFRGEGYARESASAVMEYAKKTFGFNRLLAITSPDNYISAIVLEKLGFRFEKMIKLSDDGAEIKLFAADF